MQTGMIQCQQEQSNAKFDGSHTNWLTGGNFNTVFEWYLCYWYILSAASLLEW